MSILKKLREQTRPLGVKEIAELFDVSEGTIQRWVRRGEIPAIRVSDTIRFDPGVLADWIEQRISRTLITLLNGYQAKTTSKGITHDKR